MKKLLLLLPLALLLTRPAKSQNSAVSLTNADYVWLREKAKTAIFLQEDIQQLKTVITHLENSKAVAVARQMECQQQGKLLTDATARERRWEQTYRVDTGKLRRKVKRRGVVRWVALGVGLLGGGAAGVMLTR